MDVFLEDVKCERGFTTMISLNVSNYIRTNTTKIAFIFF